MVEDVRHVSYRINRATDNSPGLYEVAYRVGHASHRCRDVRTLFSQATAHITKMPTATVSSDAIGASDVFAAGGIHLDWGGSAPEFADGYLIRCLVGEALHSLRSSLDSLVYNIAWLDGGKENPRTQFPAAEARKDWGQETRGPRLRGVSRQHLDWLEEVQPFMGCTWSRKLARYSNWDKHRYLIDIMPSLQFRVDLHSAAPQPTDEGKMSLAVDEIQYAPLMRSRDREDEGDDVREVLGEILLGVGQLVNRFMEERGDPPLVMDREE